MALINCQSVSGGDIVNCCGTGSVTLMGEWTGSSANDCRAQFDSVCESNGGTGFDEFGDGSTCSSTAPKKPRLTSGISRMRSASGSDGPRIKQCPCLVEGLNSAMENPTISCPMSLYRSCRHCCRYYQNYGRITSDSANMRSATGGGKAKVATAVNWLTPLI